MILEFLREFIGSPPSLNGVADIPALFEYFAGIVLLMMVMSSIYMVFSNIFRLFSKRS